MKSCLIWMKKCIWMKLTLQWQLEEQEMHNKFKIYSQGWARFKTIIEEGLETLEN